MDEARRLGVSVQLVHIDDDRRLGEYRDNDAEILIDLGVTMPQLKETLAHELAHAHYGHRCTTDRNERRADRRAAAMLIDVAEYAAAASIHPGDPGAIAEELGVTRRMVRVFEKELLPSISLRRGA
jgi:hypothetical protein